MTSVSQKYDDYNPVRLLRILFYFLQVGFVYLTHELRLIKATDLCSDHCQVECVLS